MSAPTSPPRVRNVVDIFGAPLLLALLSAGGLLSALIGDGLWDVLSWFGLGIPVAVILWFALGRRRP
jgi:hypothetical protein